MKTISFVFPPYMPNSSYYGQIGEDIACEYLKRLKYKIVNRNFRTKLGEIDIIALDGKSLVFVEVKYGSKDAYLRVNKRKFKRITLAAKEFLRDFGDLGANRYRVDVMSVSKDGNVDHFKDIASDFGR